ncbi:c6 zinc finger domain-containing protein [Xylariaceae sp. FL0804]|nr:c6 zinc finger domain-containing protein [Xylariaceae sp. FL0804]
MNNARGRLACAACTRRKVKCSKTVPCSNCIRRGEEEACSASDLYPAATPSTLADVGAFRGSDPRSPGPRDDDLGQLPALRRRVAELEAELRRSNSTGGRALPTPTSGRADLRCSTAGTYAAAREAQGADDDDADNDGDDADDHAGDAVVQDAASILEFLAWGRRKNPDYAAVASPEAAVNVAASAGRVQDAHAQLDLALPDPIDAPGFADDLSQVSVLQLLLPDRRRTWELVLWHERCLLWYHCSYHAPSLRRQLEDFYGRLGGDLAHPGVSLQWAAFLFAVLAGSMTCMPARAAEHAGFFAATEREALSRRWCRAAIACLNRADYAARHSILSVQAIATLTVSAHALGFSDLQSIHLAAAVRIAQSLGLHRLTTADDDDVPGGGGGGGGAGGGGGGGVVERETGRRAWAQLCSQDWFSLPFSETYLVHPLYARSDPPMNCHDDEMRPLPDAVPTAAGYTRFLSAIAAIMPRLQDGLMGCHTPFTRYEQVMKWDKQLRTLATAGRPAYLSNTPIDPTWPVFVPWARRSLAISSSHKIIMIHRSFLSESFTNPAFGFTRRTCLAASKTIIKEYKSVVEEDGPVLWIHQAFSVAASIILILDALHREPGEPEAAEHLRLVEETIEILKACQNSMIALRGTRLLSALVAENMTSHAADASRKRPAPEDGESSSHRGQKRARTLNVPAFVRSFCADPCHSARPSAQSDRTDLGREDLSSTLAESLYDTGSLGASGLEDLLFLANQDFCSF